MRFLKKSIASNKVEPVTVARTQPWHYPTIIGLSNAIANNVQYGDFLDSVMFHGWLHDAFVSSKAEDYCQDYSPVASKVEDYWQDYSPQSRGLLQDYSPAASKVEEYWPDYSPATSKVKDYWQDYSPAAPK